MLDSMFSLRQDDSPPAQHPWTFTEYIFYEGHYHQYSGHLCGFLCFLVVVHGNKRIFVTQMMKRKEMNLTDHYYNCFKLDGCSIPLKLQQKTDESVKMLKYVNGELKVCQCLYLAQLRCPPQWLLDSPHLEFK